MKRKASRIDASPSNTIPSFLHRLANRVCFPERRAGRIARLFPPDAFARVCHAHCVSHGFGATPFTSARSAKTITGAIMDNTIRSYRGLEIYPLVFPHQPRGADRSRHYDSGFDAAVRIGRRGADNTLTASRVFPVSGPGPRPFGDS